MEEEKNMENIIFSLISFGGTAKSLAYEALEMARDGNYDKAGELLKESDEILKEAQNTQKNLIEKEASGEESKVSLLMVHAQDHLMAAVEAKTLIEYMIEMYKKINH